MNRDPSSSETSGKADQRKAFVVAASLSFGIGMSLLVGLLSEEEERLGWQQNALIGLVAGAVFAGGYLHFARQAKAGVGPFVPSPVAALPRAQRREIMRRLRRGEAAPDPETARLQDATAIHLLRQRWQFVLLAALMLPQVVDLVTGSMLGWWFAGPAVLMYVVLGVVAVGLRRRMRESVLANQARWGDS